MVTNTSSGIGGMIGLALQVILLVMHYGNSTWLGIEWAALPWWIVWFPALIWLIVLVFIVVLFLVWLIYAVFEGD